MSPKWLIELLAGRHEREDFDCGKSTLNDYLKEKSGQHARKGMGRTYVAVAPDNNSVLGYYTISSGNIAFESVPVGAALPNYPIPVVHIGKLAVDKRLQRQGLGGALLVDALKRAARAADEIGIHAVTVRALDDDARKFYLRYGFTPTGDDPLDLYLPMKTIRKL